MSEGNMLRSALAEVLRQCDVDFSTYNEGDASLSDATSQEHLDAARAAFERFSTTEVQEERSAIAREVLAAVARFRTSLGSRVSDPNTSSTDLPPNPEESSST